MDSEFEGAFEVWDGCWIDDELDGTGLAGCALDEAALFQADEHGIDRGWREIEELLEIRVSGSHSSAGFLERAVRSKSMESIFCRSARVFQFSIRHISA